MQDAILTHPLTARLRCSEPIRKPTGSVPISRSPRSKMGLSPAPRRFSDWLLAGGTVLFRRRAAGPGRAGHRPAPRQYLRPLAGTISRLSPTWVLWTDEACWIGVQIFFVISGFVIAYSLRMVLA